MFTIDKKMEGAMKQGETSRLVDDWFRNKISGPASAYVGTIALALIRKKS